jgi:hypothetical protein
MLPARGRFVNRVPGRNPRLRVLIRRDRIPLLRNSGMKVDVEGSPKLRAWFAPGAGTRACLGAAPPRAQTSFFVRSASLLSRPDLVPPGRGAQRRGWEERSHAQARPWPREHGEDGEHRTFPEVSSVARLTVVGRSGAGSPLRNGLQWGLVRLIAWSRCAEYHFMRHLTPPLFQPAL